ncbi:CheR family methyltransferase [Parathalassolituus penaei]|uniref:protein-glutamate O-methyltransferase n=1 Tax=Parathalassolituus penaei TaxID=2997323 RepID=A0A9X3ITD7_9GAMM|nr:CheR family methyltransferase [Parathalassolituus penaei]MCY0965799.1 protein-glutamate O-methyltransferase CheR [Parathalassolituus penaei]
MNHPIRPAISSLSALDNEQFSRWQALLEERTGMCMPEQRRTFLQTSLGIRMREVGVTDYSEYYNRVVDGPAGAIEWNTLVDRLTVQETRFFRDPDAFAFVENFICNQRSQLSDKNPLEIWSVGCSTGEEAYSLAMLADRQLTPFHIKYAVTGTDISTFALRKAKSASYPETAIKWFPQEFRTDAMLHAEHGKKLQVSDIIRQRCCFTQVNLLDLKAFPLQSQHIIYCQNVLIYFRRWRRREILNELAERLVPGGILVIGLGEIVDWRNPLLESVGGGKVTAFVRKQTNTNRETERR